MGIANFKSFKAALMVCAAFIAPAGIATAQTPHGIAATVNEDIITTYDLRQRVLFNLMASGVTPDESTLQRMQIQALRSLVDEQIQMQEAKKFDLTVGDAEVERSVTRLAQGNNVSVAELTQQMASVGVNLNTLRDQVRAEVAWQRIINGRYGSRIRISDTQIDETINRLSANVNKPSYLVSEIFIEATPDIGGMEGATEGARAMIDQVEKGAPFTALARQFSSSATAAQGGDMGWVRDGELRAEVNAAIGSMEKGTVSEPIMVPGGVYVVALRDTRQSSSETVYKLEQVRITAETPDDVNAAKASLEALKLSLTSCGDVEDAIEDIANADSADMGEVKASEVGEDILTILSNTDVNALSDPMELDGGVMALMVCGRKVQGAGIPTRQEVEDRLIDQQLAQSSKRYLRDLRRAATIETR